MADSSIEAAFELETLAPRSLMALKGEVWFGEPDRPTVLSERRRRLASWAAAVMGPLYWFVGGLLLVSDERLRLAPKRSAKV